MRIKGEELKAFMVEAWPGENGEWYLDCDDEVFDGDPDSLVAGKVYDTNDLGPLYYGGCGEDPSNGNGWDMDTLIRRWRRSRTHTPVTVSVPNGKLEEFWVTMKTLGVKEGI